MMLVARQRSGSAAFAKASPQIMIRRSRSCGHRGGQRPNPAPRAGWGRRPQRPGNQYTLTRISGMSPGNSPSRIAGLPLALPQSSGRLGKISRLLHNTL
jgi:hypothetical protein